MLPASLAAGEWLSHSQGGYSIQTTTGANARFLFALAPFFAAISGWFILRESVRKSTWIVTLQAALGITVMVINGFSAGHMIGNFSALLFALGFAAVTPATLCNFGEFNFLMSINDASI